MIFYGYTSPKVASNYHFLKYIINSNNVKCNIICLKAIFAVSTLTI